LPGHARADDPAGEPLEQRCCRSINASSLCLRFTIACIPPRLNIPRPSTVSSSLLSLKGIVAILVLIVPPGNPLDRRTDVRLCDVAEAATPLYLVEWTAGLRALIDEAVRPARALVEIPFEMAHRFVASGRGATFATRAMVADDLAAGRLCAVPVSDLPPLSYENAVVSLRGVSLPRSVAAFLDVLRAEIGAGADANT